MNKAIFFDRDGVINRERGEYTFRLEDFEILPDVEDVLFDFQERGYLLIIISNQGGVGKGLYSNADVEVLHQYLLKKLEARGVQITEIYYCPHHPEKGKCLCRKPDSLMVEKAIARFDIDASQSYFIGDKERDILAGEKVGVKGILIAPNSSLKQLVINN